MGSLNRDNVQSLVLGPAFRPVSRHLLFSVPDMRGGRRFVAEMMPILSRGDPATIGGPPIVNVSVSWNGLLALGAFDEVGGPGAANAAFYMFNEPPHAESLRAFGESAPAKWWNGRFATNAIHLIIHLAAMEASEVDALTLRIRRAAENGDLQELISPLDGEAITGRAIEGRHLHFGYPDGISHPDVDWDADVPRSGFLPRGDFLLGYPSPNYATYPNKPPFSDFVRDGSLVAFMLLHQDVAAFNAFLRINAHLAAPNLPQAEAEEYLAAKMMGRWRDGSPLALYPDKPSSDGDMRDDFGYADDPNGMKCPLAAHIRVAYGRDQPLNPLNTDLFPGGFPRLLRRGSPYGPPLDGEVDDGVDRGIVGMFLCANLNQQFYTIMRWLGRTDFSPLFSDQVGQDPIVGNLSFPGASPTFSFCNADGNQISLTRVVDFVRLKGVALQLLPSLSALQQLSS